MKKKYDVGGNQSNNNNNINTANESNELLLMSLTRFYNENMVGMKTILPILDKTSPISLRLIDWFVTNYSKKYKIAITNKDHKFFNVYSNYRSQLKAFKKTQFDPFRRRDRIDFYYDTENFIETTIGQLNFFRWFIQNSLLDYVNANYHAIENDMIMYNSTHSSTASIPPSTIGNIGKPTKMLSKNFISNMNHYNERTIIDFI